MAARDLGMNAEAWRAFERWLGGDAPERRDRGLRDGTRVGMRQQRTWARRHRRQMRLIVWPSWARGQLEACRFGCQDPAVAWVSLSAGCLCFPEDTEQALCLHHAMRASPQGTIDVFRLRPETPPWVRAILVKRYPEVSRL